MQHCYHEGGWSGGGQYNMFSFPVITTALYIIGQEMIYDRFVITVGQTVEL